MPGPAHNPYRACSQPARDDSQSSAIFEVRADVKIEIVITVLLCKLIAVVRFVCVYDFDFMAFLLMIAVNQ